MEQLNSGEMANIEFFIFLPYDSALGAWQNYAYICVQPLQFRGSGSVAELNSHNWNNQAYVSASESVIAFKKCNGSAPRMAAPERQLRFDAALHCGSMRPAGPAPHCALR